MTDCCPVNHEDLVKVRAPAVKNGHMTGSSCQFSTEVVAPENSMDSKLFGFPSQTSRKFLRLAVDTSQTSVLLGLAQQPVVTERPTFGQTRKPSGVESHDISGATVKPGKDISSTKTQSFASSKRTHFIYRPYVALHGTI